MSLEIIMEEFRPIWGKNRESSVKESCTSMKASIQIWKKKLEAVVFKKDELHFRDLSEPKTLLPNLPNQDSNFEVEIKFQDI